MIAYGNFNLSKITWYNNTFCISNVDFGNNGITTNTEMSLEYFNFKIFSKKQDLKYRHSCFFFSYKAIIKKKKTAYKR